MNALDLAVKVPSPTTALGRRALAWLRDPRDFVFLHVMLTCALVAGLGVGMYFVPARWLPFVAPVYWLAWGLGALDRFMLMLHCTSHRPLFKPSALDRNLIIPWLIGPFFGQTPGTYFAHHMGMHHPENNLAGDLSSTMPYQRGKATHWLRYFGSFMAFGLYDLARYHQRRGNRRLFWKTLVGELSFVLLVVGLSFVAWRATLVVFVIPFVVVRALMMAGNWGQHAFVDPTDAGNPFRNSITCINTRYNRRCFNDGYHINHHQAPRAHFSEYPAEFAKNAEEYGRNDAIVFDGIDFFQVWLALMFGRFGSLADRFVQLPGAPKRDRAEVIELLRSRVGGAQVADLGLATEASAE